MAYNSGSCCHPGEPVKRWKDFFEKLKVKPLFNVKACNRYEQLDEETSMEDEFPVKRTSQTDNISSPSKRRSTVTGKNSYLVEICETMLNSDQTSSGSKNLTGNFKSEERRKRIQSRRASSKKNAINMKKKLYEKRSISIDFEFPKNLKTSEEKDFIRKNIALHFPFSHANDQCLSYVTDAFEKAEFKKDEVIIRENENGDYFYLIEFGLVLSTIRGNEVGFATATECFGELALLYDSPRAATCMAGTDCKLWRIDRKTFVQILSNVESNDTNNKKALLRRVPFLSSSSDMFLENMTKAMETKHFSIGDQIITKGESEGTLYLIKKGKVKVHDILSAEEKEIDDKCLIPGGYFGELSIVTKQKAIGNITAITDCELLAISGDYFDKMEGTFNELVIEANYTRMLTDILSILEPEPYQIKWLSTSVFHVELDKGTLFHEVKSLPKKGIYFVLSGIIRTQVYEEIQEKKVGDVFGIETILDEEQLKNTEVIGDCKLGVLSDETLKANTSLLKYKKRNQVSKKNVTSKIMKVQATQCPVIGKSGIRVHSELGRGAFGQVWLTSFPDDEKKKTYALKEIEKKSLIEKDCVPMILREARILTTTKHPFIIDLVNVFQNKTSLFMLFPVISGGELYELMEEYTFFSEKAARFYAGVLLETLSYLHQRNILYRDLKPENILLDKDGYCILVDFGFAKQTHEKTFTLCGTPLYLAPETILNQGQDVRVDCWAWAVILFEVISGEHPFFEDGDSQMMLFRKICKGIIYIPDDIDASDEFFDLMKRSLQIDEQKRIGSLNGSEEFRAHKWFDKFDFESLRKRKMEAPWKPDVEDEQNALGDGQKLMSKSNKHAISDDEQSLFADFGTWFD